MFSGIVEEAAQVVDVVRKDGNVDLRVKGVSPPNITWLMRSICAMAARLMRG